MTDEAKSLKDRAWYDEATAYIVMPTPAGPGRVLLSTAGMVADRWERRGHKAHAAALRMAAAEVSV
jgi:hypothetical protein